MIVDDHGRPVYFLNLPPKMRAFDVRVQTYRGQPVLTYWRGTNGVNPGYGSGSDYIVDQHYRVLQVVTPGCSGMADMHEFLLTPNNTALVTCYDLTRVDARSMGGSANQAVLNGVVQEIDLNTHKAVFTWRSLAHVPITDSYTRPLPGQPDQPWDYFHINAVKLDLDSNLLISSRHTWTVYRVDHRTGRILWQLGGKHSDFTFEPGSAFSWQHDPEPLGHYTFRIFDNAWNQLPDSPPTHPRSRVLTLKLDPVNHTVQRVGRLTYPNGELLAGSQGNSQALPRGHVFVGWGSANHITEFNADGQMIFDAHFPANYDTYRAYRSRWVGTPNSAPSAVITSPGGTRQVDAVWNGATTVVRWRIIGGPGPDRMGFVGSIAWSGLDTAFRLPTWPAYLRVAAVDSSGHVIKESAIQRIR
jgi:hypothetical protein